MSVGTIRTGTERWNRPEYQRMVSAVIDDGDIIIGFEDGSTARVKAANMLPAEVRSADWSLLAVSPYQIVIPAANGPAEVPWSTIRMLTDPGYNAHLANAAEVEARQIGLRIKALREARNLTGKELAESADITPHKLSKIEHGKHDIVFTTLRQILAAMGCTLRDLAG